MQDGNSCRLSLTTLKADPKSKNESNPMIPIEATGKWTIVCIDLDYTFNTLKAYPKTNLFRKYKFELSGITICADSYVRGVYTSDNLYSFKVDTSNKTLPKEINYRKPKKGEWGDTYSFWFFPQSNYGEALRIDNQVDREGELARQQLMARMQGKDVEQMSLPLLMSDPTNPLGGYRAFNQDIYIETEKKNVEITQEVVGIEEPEPEESLMQLERVVGFTGRTCPDIKFSKTNPDVIYYASGNIIVRADIADFSNQLFLTGHTAPITCMDLSHDGKILATCQEGNHPLLRFWRTDTNRCIGKFNLKLAEARCISFNCHGYTLCAVGSDKMARDEILVIDAEVDQKSGMIKAQKIAHQVSEFNILTIKFSPIEPDKLVSCGKENIRFWRIKNGHLPGGAVVLDRHARDTIFTVFDFDFGKTDQPRLAARDDVVKRVLVGSKHGYLYQVNYDTRALEAVIKLHDLSICSIVVSPGFCVTGSQDQYVRVWQLDFSEFFLEAQVESIIISLDVSLDGINIACGTSANSLNILDTSSQDYKTLLRSHSDTITSMKYQEENNLLVTLSKDLSIRIWDDNNLDQLYEFLFTRDDECCSIDIHPKKKIFVGGFRSGMFRVFAIETTSVVGEHKFHNKPIEDIKFSSSGKFLGLGDSVGFYTLVDCTSGFEFVKTFESELNNNKICCEFTPDERFFCTIGALNSCINVWNMETFSKHYSVSIKGSFIHSFKFSRNTLYELFVLTCDSKVKVYTLEKGKAVQSRELLASHDQFISDLGFVGMQQYMVTAGGDRLVKMWDYWWSKPKRGNESKGVFHGHACPIYSIVATRNGRVYSSGGSEGIFCWKVKPSLTSQNKYPGSILSTDHLTGVPKLEEMPTGTEAHLKADHDTQRLEGVHIPGLKDETKFNYQVSIARGEKDLEDLSAFEDRKNQERMKQKSEEESKKKERVIKGLLRQSGRIKFKKLFGFVPSQFEKLISYVRNQERDQLELPQKHFYMPKKDAETLTQRTEKLNSNSKIMTLQYVAGLNTSAHDNLIWNTRFNCLIYSFENKIILEEFEDKRTQTVINLPEIVSSLHLGEDGCLLVAGCGSINQDIWAPVYVIDLETNTLKSRLNHHTRGVQGVRFSPGGKYILSYGNFRDTKIAIWKDNTTLAFSTQDIFPMNEAKWRPEKVPVPGTHNKTDFEFCIGGKNRLTVWRYHEDLNRCSIKSERGFDSGGYTRDVTTVEYVRSLMKGWLILAGMSTGAVAFVDPEDCSIIAEYSFSLKEISVAKFNLQNDKVVIGTMAGEIFHWRFNVCEPDSIDMEVDVRKFKLESGIVNLDLDPDSNEGVASTIDAQIAFITLNNSKYANFIQGVDTHNLTEQLIKLGDKTILTIQHLGDAKLWNSQTGEILKEFKWKEQIVHAIFVPEKNLVVFFLLSHDIVTMPLDDFNKIRLYKNDNLELITNTYLDNYVNRSISMPMDENRRLYLFGTYKGATLISDFLGQDTFDFRWVHFEGLNGNISDFEYHEKERLLAIATNKGHINLYKCDDPTQGLDQANFYLLEDFNCVEKPHGDLDTNVEELEATTRLYGFKSHEVNVKFMLSQRKQYCYILRSLQYIYVRDFEEKQLKYMITIDSFPRCLARDPFNNRILVGREDGIISLVDERAEKFSNYMSHLADFCEDIVVVENELRYIVGSQFGFLVYKTN